MKQATVPQLVHKAHLRYERGYVIYHAGNITEGKSSVPMFEFPTGV
jgi:hypothetical protein